VSTKPGQARVFFALWPDPAVREALAALAQSCEAECGGRLTAPAKIHLTLFFVGEIGRAALTRLHDVADAITAAPFALVLTELGYWRHNRIVWAAARCPPALALLVSELTRELARLGLRGEERPYVPHVTLLRNARRAPASNTFSPIDWRAREFVLVESVAAHGGSRYEVIARWPLRDA
jgi:RNA 2',3'-cyclic 3'-phosphodiesterase